MRKAWPLALALLLALTPTTLARDDGDRDGRREVKLSFSESHALFKMERRAGGVEDEVKVALDAPKATLKLEYERHGGGNKTESEMKVQLRRLVEFSDADGDGAYDPGVDRVVAPYDVEDLRWRVEAPVDVTSSSGQAGKRIVGVGTFPSGGRLSLVLSAYGDFATVNGTSLRPTDAKIDILLDDFPFHENGTRVALLVKTEAEVESKTRHATRDGSVEGIQASIGDLVTYFTWADFATVDGVDQPVRTTLVKSSREEEVEAGKAEVEREETFWFSYARGRHVNHDPVLGVASASEVEPRGVPAPAPVALVAAVAVLALVLPRRR